MRGKSINPSMFILSLTGFNWPVHIASLASWHMPGARKGNWPFCQQSGKKMKTEDFCPMQCDTAFVDLLGV